MASRLVMKRMIRRLLRTLIYETEEVLLYEINRKHLLANNRETRANILSRYNSFEDARECFGDLRISVNSFNTILSKVERVIQKSDTLMRHAIPTKIKLLVVFTYLTTGCSLRNLEENYKISKSSLSLMLVEVCDAICEVLKRYTKMPETKDDWNEIENGFRNKWNFPSCCGAMKGKCIMYKEQNSKGINSVTLMAMVDHNYCFRYVDLINNGNNSENSLFRNNDICTVLENNLPCGKFFIGDYDYSLRTNLMKPFSGDDLTVGQKIFNYRLARANRTAENAFGVLMSKFLVFQNPTLFNLDEVKKITKTCISIHNWLITTDNNYIQDGLLDVEDIKNGKIINGSWRKQQIDCKIPPVLIKSSQHYSIEARKIRETLLQYFMGGGILDWQMKMICQ